MLLLYALALVFLAAPQPAKAQAHAQACIVEARGELDEAWTAATASLAELDLTHRDCQHVRITLEGDQARVIFTTLEGKAAERVVTAPSDLRPTINALRVQAPAPAPVRVPVPAPPSASPPSAPAPSAEPNPTALRFALLTGIRGGSEALFSPLLIGDLGLGLGRVELGASLAAEVQYFDFANMRSPDRQAGTAALHINAGIRQPAGAVDLRAGARLGVAYLLTINHEAQSCPVGVSCPFRNEDERTSEWRFGAYAGIVVPRRSTLRFRTELGADFIAPPAEDGALPLTPAWALNMLVGLEVAP